MKLLTVLLLIFGIQTLVSADMPTSYTEAETKASELNQESINKLGISLKSLQFLLGAHKTSFLPAEFHQENLMYFKQLESKGYVTIKYSERVFPDSPEKVKVIQLLPTTMGSAVINVLSL